MDDEGPPIGHDDEEEFQGEGDGEGGEHHHSHGEEDVGGDKVDDEEGEVDEYADFERPFDLGGDEGGHEDDEVVDMKSISIVFREAPEGKLVEIALVGGEHVPLEELFEGPLGFVGDLDEVGGGVGGEELFGDLFLHIGFGCVVHGEPCGEHDVEGHQEGNAI